MLRTEAKPFTRTVQPQAVLESVTNASTQPKARGKIFHQLDCRIAARAVSSCTWTHLPTYSKKTKR